MRPADRPLGRRDTVVAALRPGPVAAGKPPFAPHVPFIQPAAASCVFPAELPPFSARPAELPGGPRRMRVMAEYSYLVLYLPRGIPRDVARRILTDHAEYGYWELARLRLNADGSRKATLRRPIIRPVRTLR